MKATITFLMFSLVSIFSFGYSTKRSVDVSAPAQSPAPSSYVHFYPKKNYATPEEQNMINQMSSKVESVVKSDCFKNFLLKTRLIQTGGRSNQEVLSHILSLKGDVPVVMYYRCMKSFKCPFGTSAVAYRKPPKTEINLNRAYFDYGDSVCEWASTVAHEGLGHTLGGYDHDFNWNKDRDYSVPYSLNRAFTECCK